MRIAFITYEFPPNTGKGGIGTYTAQTASMLAGEDCDVHVFAGSHDREQHEILNGVHVHRILCSDPHDFTEKVLNPFSADHAVSKFDLIEAPEIHANASRIKAELPDLPLVVRLHAPNWLVERTKEKYIPLTSKLFFSLGALRRGEIDAGYWRTYDVDKDPDRTFAMMADSITTPSHIMKKWATEHWRIPADSITVMPNPFQPPRDLIQQPIAADENVEVVFFGRLNVLKGLVNATRAMKTILRDHPACTFKVVGDDGPGPDRKTTMREWMQTELQPHLDRVTFRDGVPYESLAGEIRSAAIALLPSLFESFSYACAEAMAAGKAVIGSRGTGMEDLIRDGSTGMLIGPDNPREIAAALDQLIRDKALRQRLSVAARKEIASQFSEERLGSLYLDHYQRVAAITPR